MVSDVVKVMQVGVTGERSCPALLLGSTPQNRKKCSHCYCFVMSLLFVRSGFDFLTM